MDIVNSIMFVLRFFYDQTLYTGQHRVGDKVPLRRDSRETFQVYERPEEFKDLLSGTQSNRNDHYDSI